MNARTHAGLQASYRKTSDLVPYARNARTHTANQIAQLKGLIVEFGWTNPVLADARGIVAGHGRVMAANELYEAGRTIKLPNGETLPQGTVPVIDCTGWTDAQRRAYILADNQSGMNSAWDKSLLRLELAELEAAEFDTELIGFSEDELAALVEGEDESASASHYVKAINTPVYEPKGDKPEISVLVDRTKTLQLVNAIRAAKDITDAERDFLLLAASRHTVFDYHQIAEFYCHASPAMQALMEDSALVIIDFDKAIGDGFVHMSKMLGEVYERTYPDGDGPADGDPEDDDAQ